MWNVEVYIQYLWTSALDGNEKTVLRRRAPIK